MPLAIDDGIELPFAVSIENGELLSGTYRPATQAEAAKYAREFEAVRPDADAERVRLRANYLAAHVLTWDATNRKGEPVPPTADVMAKLPPGYAGQLVTLVSG